MKYKYQCIEKASQRDLLIVCPSGGEMLIFF